MLSVSSIRQRIATFLALMLLFIQLNNIVFRHTHRLPNGKVITHAHPYKPVGNSPYQPNNHTTNELYLLDAVCNAIFVAFPVVGFTFEALPLLFIKRVCLGYTTPLFVFFLDNFSLRGPPSFC